MAAASKPEVAVRYEGRGTASEIMGSTQANFLVAIPGHHAKEVAILLNSAATALLADASGREDSEEFRVEASRQLGQRWLEKKGQQGAHLDSIVMISKTTLLDQPKLVADLKRALTK